MMYPLVGMGDIIKKLFQFLFLLKDSSTIISFLNSQPVRQHARRD